MLCLRPSRTVTVWGVVVGFLGGSVGFTGGSAQDLAPPPQPWQVITEISERFDLLQDSEGYFWQASANGAITSGATEYLPSGLNLLVDGAAFAPKSASRRGDWQVGEQPGSNPELQVKETRDGLVITREILFDLEGATVRVVDLFQNTGPQAKEVKLDLRTTYPVAWQDLFDESGQVYSSTTKNSGSGTVVVDFGASEGRQETLFVLGALGAKIDAVVKSSANSRELTFSYGLAIPAGETRGVVHWMLQRPLRDPFAAAEAFAAVQTKGRLLTALPREWSGVMVNIGSEALPEEQTTPAQLKSLVALNELMDRIGQHRRKSALLWLSATNLLTGTVSGETLETAGPEVEGKTSPQVVPIPMADVAALRGGMGLGLDPLVYLRNGEVKVGKFTAPDLQFQTGPESPPITLKVEDLHLLLFATGSNDGVPPTGTTFYLQTRSGAVEAKNTIPDLQVHMPWGQERLEAKDLAELIAVTEPSPRWRLRTIGGEEYAAAAVDFLGGTDAIHRVWKAGATGILLDEKEDEWFVFEDVPRPLPKGPACLLDGNTILAASLVPGTLDWMVEGVALPVDAAQIVSMTKAEGSDDKAGWNVVLADGNAFFGSLKAPCLAIQHGEYTIKLPVSQLRAFRAL